jgi:hypothetical protein
VYWELETKADSKMVGDYHQLEVKAIMEWVVLMTMTMTMMQERQLQLQTTTTGRADAGV